MGCLFRLGCLFLLVCAAIVGWFTRDRWMPASWRARIDPPPARTATWQPLTDSGADRTRAALEKLSQPSGPVFQTLSGADVASYAFRELSKDLPEADSVGVLVKGEQISMRANVKTSDIRGLSAIGVMLGDREHVEMTGTMRVVRPGLGEFEVGDARIRGLSIPRGMIGTMLDRISRGARPAGVDQDALPLPLPSYVGDIRVANGKVTLYKNVK